MTSLQRTYRIVRIKRPVVRIGDGSPRPDPVVGGTTGGLAAAGGRAHAPSMKKRILVAALWFYACWYGAAHLAEFMSLDPMIGPIVGATVAMLVTVDPFGLFWARQPKARRSPEAAPGAG